MAQELLLLRVLYIEDSESDALLISLALKRAGYAVRAQRVFNAATMRAALLEQLQSALLGEPWDVVIADYNLPSFSVTAALALLREYNLDLPFIIVSGAIREEDAVSALRAGAHDFITKGNLARLAPAIARELREVANRRQRKRAEAQSELSAEILKRVNALVLMADAEGKISYASPSVQTVLGYAPEDVLGDGWWQLTRKTVEQAAEQDYLSSVARGERPLDLEPYERQVLDREGRPHWISWQDAYGPGGQVVGVGQDITVRKQAEAAVGASEQRLRTLFEASPIALWEEDHSLVKRRLDELRAQGVSDFAAYFASHPAAVGELSRLIKILDVNQKAVTQYHAHSKAELLASLAIVFDTPGDPIFNEEMIRIAQGETHFNLEVVNRTIDGEIVNLSLNWAVVPGHEADLARVIISTIDVTHQRRAEAEARQRLNELEVINRISAALREAQTLEAMLPLLLAETIATLDGNAGSIWFYEPETDDVRLVYEQGWGRTPPPYKRGEGVPGYVVATGQPYVTRELKTDPRMPELMRDLIPAGRGGACVPIRAGDEIIGVLYLNADLPRALSPDDVRLLGTLAEIAGNAIHRSRLFQQTEERLQRLTALRTIDMAISASMDLKLTLQVLLQQVTGQLAVDAAVVLLLDPAAHKLTYAAGHGLRTRGLEQTNLKLGEGFAGRAALERKIVQVSDLVETGSVFRRAALIAGEEFVSYVAGPLVAKGNVIGLLECFHRSRLEPQAAWLSFFETLAGQAAIAVEQASLLDHLRRSNTDLRLAYDATIEGWSAALDLRDHETEGHSQRVTALTLRLAPLVGIAGSELTYVKWGALLHDIGKMGIPDAILLKPAALTPEERAIMERHPLYAHRLLAPVAYLGPALDIPYCHHEKWDGTGYPQGLQGEQIPLAARVFAIVDVWDALTSIRPYRPAWPVPRVRAHIGALAGTHFDPAIVEKFLGLNLGPIP